MTKFPRAYKDLGPGVPLGEALRTAQRGSMGRIQTSRKLSGPLDPLDPLDRWVRIFLEILGASKHNLSYQEAISYLVIEAGYCNVMPGRTEEY